MAIERALCPVLIGREKELSLLEDALLAANRGEGQVVVLAGEAGMGKTRLATHLQQRAQKGGTQVLWGGCSEAELALPYLPFLEAIGNYLATADLDQLRQRLGSARQELAHLFPKLGGDRSLADPTDPFQGKLRLFEAILELLSLAAAEHGLLVVLDDLHWADASTRELLDYLSRRVRNTRVLVLGTYRQDELHRKHPLLPMLQGWRRAGVASVIELEALPPDRVADMVRAILDAREVRDETRDFLHKRTEGNPFVLEEMLKAALDRGDIFRTETGWSRKELSEIRLPDSVRETILLRVERLSAEQAEILRTASVFGPSFAFPTLVAVSGRAQDAVLNALRACVQQQLIQEDSSGGGRYRFRHALTREAVYEDLIGPEREAMHARAAEVLRSQAGTAPVDLAFHLLAARRWEEAVPMCLTAAEDAERRRGYREAAELYERALPYVTDRLTRAQTLCRVGEAHFMDGDPGRAQRYLEEGIALLEESGEHLKAARSRLILGNCYRERSRPDLARGEYERVVAILEPAGPSEDLAYAYVRLAAAYAFEFRLVETLDFGRRGLAIAEQANSPGARAWAFAFIGMATAVALQDVDQALEYLDRSYREAVEQGLDWIALNALHNGIALCMWSYRTQEAIGKVRLLRALHAGGRQNFWATFDEAQISLSLGELAKARAGYAQAQSLAREAGATTFVSWIQRLQALVEAASGRFEEARRLLPPDDPTHERMSRIGRAQAAARIFLDGGEAERAIEAAQPLLETLNPPAHQHPLERWLLLTVIEAFLKVGRIPEAEALMHRAGGDIARDPVLGRGHGLLSLARSDHGRAVSLLSEAAESFDRVGFRLEQSRTRRALAEAKARQGDRAGAEAELRKVLAYADEFGAVFEGQCARRQLAELGVEIDAAPAVAETPELRQPSERLVTALFVDVRGYTAATAKEAPQATAEKVQSLFRWASLEIERHHGVVDQYAGDAVLATFNVSGARLDHALHALQAAIAIRDKATYGGLPVGMGIAVGPAVVGQLAKDGNVTAVGDTVNLASRLQTQAQAGEILLSAEAFRRTREWLEQQQVPASPETLTLKGFTEAVPAHRLRAPVRAG